MKVESVGVDKSKVRVPLYLRHSRMWQWAAEEGGLQKCLGSLDEWNGMVCGAAVEEA